MEYPKIETLYNRDMDTFKVTRELRCPEFGLIERWALTEKIDGTNVRIFLKADGSVTFGGRTSKAQMPTHLLEYLQATFPAEKVAAAFDHGTEATLFGEGYGPKIQKGGNYSPVVRFRLFDVVVLGLGGRPWWLEWDDVEDVAGKLGIETVPVVHVYDGPLTWDGLRGLVGSKSIVARLDEGDPDHIQEGIVARTRPMLLTRRGYPLRWKLKVKDFLAK